MLLIVNCSSRSNASLLAASVEATSLVWQDSQQSATGFLEQITFKQPRFALLTQESINHPDLLASIRCASPNTHIIICWLSETPISQHVRDRLAPLEFDVFCTLSELTDCLLSLQQSRSYGSSLRAAHPYLNLKTKEPFAGWRDLTPTERRVLKQLAEIRTAPQIAKAMHISPKTVNNHKAKISQKLNVSGGPGSLNQFVVTNRDRLRQLLE